MNPSGQLPEFSSLLQSIQSPVNTINTDQTTRLESLIVRMKCFNDTNNRLIEIFQDFLKNPSSCSKQPNSILNETIGIYPQIFHDFYNQLMEVYLMVNSSNRSIEYSGPKYPNLPNYHPQIAHSNIQTADQEAAQALGQLQASFIASKPSIPPYLQFSLQNPNTFPSQNQPPTTPFKQVLVPGQKFQTPNQSKSIFECNHQTITPPLVTPSPPRSRTHSFDKKEKPIPNQCAHCHKRNTPEWRKGPDNKRNLCNACGIFYAKLVKIHGCNLAKIILIVKQYRNENKDCSKDRSLPRPLELESYIKIYEEKYLHH